MSGVFDNAFPSAGGGGGSVATPTLVIVDNGDGTLTATISGSTAGTTNTVYYLPADMLSEDWTELGSRSGDGDVTESLAVGAYWFHVVSAGISDEAVSNVVYARVTDADAVVTVTPEEWLALELHHLRELVVASECWRACVALPNDTWANVKALADAQSASASDARAKVIIERTDEDDEDHDYPRAVVRHMTGEDAERIGAGAFEISGKLILLFELPVPDVYADAPEAATYDFGNKIGRIIREMSVAVGGGGVLAADNIQRGPTGQIDPDDIGGQLVRCAEFIFDQKGVF